ncbi:MAG: CTP synthetase [Alphaproteobacteria bacterium]
MLRLASVLYAIVSTTVMGMLIIVALVAGYDTLKYILIAVGVGAVISLPISYYIAAAIKAED